MEAVLTWESECLPTLDLRNVAAGDIAICTLWTPVTEVSPLLELPRIAIVGPLRTKAGLGWLLRGLYLYPAIRHLVVCGKDVLKSGDAVVTLWERGLTAQGTLLGSDCRPYPEMDKEALDFLRGYVRVWDWRDRNIEELRRRLTDLPYLPAEIKPRSFPPVVIPEQVTFSSRKTTFPLFAEELGDGWLQLLNLVLRCGTVKRTMEGDVRTELINVIVTVKLAGEREELSPCFDFSATEVENYYHHFVFTCLPEYTGCPYGERLQSSVQFSEEKSKPEVMSQLGKVFLGLKDFPDSEPVSVVIPSLPGFQAMHDAPCIISLTFNVVEGKLYGTYVMRSDDVYNAWPLHAVCLTRLQRKVAKQIGAPVGSATFISHSAYISRRDWARAWSKLDRWFKRPLPFQPDCSGLFFFSVENDQVRALLVTPEVDKVLWEATSRDPQELVRYIVDTMPWLASQHIRYLGEEAARLARALQEGVPYEQG